MNHSIIVAFEMQPCIKCAIKYLFYRLKASPIFLDKKVYESVFSMNQV